MKLYFFLFLHFTAVAIAAIPDGHKSLAMLRELDAGVLTNYDKELGTLTHQNNSFVILKGSQEHFSSTSLVCIGSHPVNREIISFQPDHSPLLQQAFQNLLTYLQTNKKEENTPRETLGHIVAFVREEIFEQPLSTEEAVNSFIETWIYQHPFSDFTQCDDEEYLPVIPIEDFIKAGSGICRHYAFVTAYLLDRILRETKLLPMGRSYYVRDMVQVGSSSGGHAWNLFIDEKSGISWHVDPLWNVVKSLSNSKDLNYLYRAYGRKAIGREIHRFSQSRLCTIFNEQI